MSAPPHRILIAVLVLLPGVTSCGDDPAIEPTSDPPSAAALVVTPETVLFTALGDTLRLGAEVRDQQGRPMSGAAVAWTSSDASVAAVAQSGVVRAVAPGAATITATSGTVSDDARITVRQDVASVAVEPRTASLVVGDTVRLSAEARDANANPVPGSAFVWRTSSEQVAGVDSTGLVRAHGRGQATITAVSAGATGSAAVSVAPPNLPPNFAVDEGTSHTLQFAGLHVAHLDIRPAGARPPSAIAYADYNGDGLIDIFYSPSDGSRSPVPAEMYINDGMGAFTLDAGFFGSNPPGGVDPRKALPGDFNGDGRPDVFVLGHGYDHEPFPGEAPYAILSSPGGYVQAVGLDSIIGFHHGGASADIDADGDLDVFVTDNFTRPFFLVNDGTGNFVPDAARIEGIGSEGIFTAELVDVDRDGYVDVLAAGHEYEGFPTQILWGDNTGVFSTMRALILPAIPGHGIVVDIDVADTDGDGDRDIVLNRTGDDSGPGWYDGYYMQLLEQTGTRTFSDITQHLLPENQNAEAAWITWLRVFDLDEDGDLDIFADEASRRLLWKNDGSGRFLRGVLREVPPNHAVDEGSSHSLQTPPFRIDHTAVRNGRPGRTDAFAYGDFDGDGDIDIYYAPMDQPPRPLPGELYANDGNGGFSLDTEFMDGNPPASIDASKAITSDFNGDGRPDILVTAVGARNDESAYVLLSSGSGHVAERIEAAAGAYGGSSADVDSDGDLDVVITSPPSILLNDGSGAFSLGSPTSTSVRINGFHQFLIAVELVDVDRDGYADILAGGHEQDEGGPTQVIWGDSSGVYAMSKRTILPPVAGHGVVLDIDVSDTDGDGDKDIVVARTGDDTGVGFYQGYYVQLIDNVGDREFRDVTSSLVSENRDDQAGSIRWLHIYDVDGDGDVDLVVDDYQETELFWRNDGGGRFRRERAGS